MPRHPDLGLPSAACTAFSCAGADAGQQERDMILGRLHVVRDEIRSVRDEATGSGERGEGEAALQKAGDLPGRVARLDGAAGLLAGATR